MDRTNPILIDHTQIHRAVPAHFKEPRMGPGVVEPVLRRQRNMVARRAGSRVALSLTILTTDDVLQGLQHGKVGRGLIAAAERRHVALETSIQLQPERRGDHHIARRLVFARVEMTRVEIHGEEDRIGKRGPERLDDEQGIVGVRPQNASRSGALSFLLNARDQRAHIIELARAFRAVPRGIDGLIAGRRLGNPCGSRRVVARHFPIQPSKIAVAKDVQGERFVVGGPLDLQIDGLRNAGAPTFDVDRHLDLFEILFRKRRHLGTGGGAELDGQGSSVEGVPLTDENHGIPTEPDLSPFQFSDQRFEPLLVRADIVDEPHMRIGQPPIKLMFAIGIDGTGCPFAGLRLESVGQKPFHGTGPGRVELDHAVGVRPDCESFVLIAV